MTSTILQGNEKAREHRLRRLAARQGLILQRSRCRTPEAPEYGTYQLVSENGILEVYGLQSGFGLTLDEIEKTLSSGADDEPGPEYIIRAKWLMDGAATLMEAAELLEGFAARLRRLSDLGWTLSEPIRDDYGFLIDSDGNRWNPDDDPDRLHAALTSAR
jgi:hypothetical protein